MLYGIVIRVASWCLMLVYGVLFGSARLSTVVLLYIRLHFVDMIYYGVCCVLVCYGVLL